MTTKLKLKQAKPFLPIRHIEPLPKQAMIQDPERALRVARLFLVAAHENEAAGDMVKADDDGGYAIEWIALAVAAFEHQTGETE